LHKISVHAKIIQPGQRPKKLSLSRRFFFVHFPAFRTLFSGEQDNFIHLPADHAEKPLISEMLPNFLQFIASQNS